ncbi:importin-13-like protein cdm isoform X2 [Oratosquilla oratoria]|uniref:importin-13-like protein cdm isoform X2 n=1 Tax=Oratosquilla oratoria TaxID=337810 RepID=UPI003F7742F6
MPRLKQGFPTNPLWRVSEMEISAEQVERTVVEFYGDPVTKSGLNTWLMQAQHSPQAWNFAWQLLHPSKPEEVQFFAGNTVYMKVSRYWNELPREQYEPLRNKILSLIAQFNTSKVVLNRLIKSLGAYVIHTIQVEWTTAIQDIINMFNPETVSGIEPSTALNLLFNILTIIPEELETMQEAMNISGKDRQIVLGCVRNNHQPVLNLISQVMHASQISNVIKETVLKTLNAWLKLSLPLSDTRELLIGLIPYAKYALLSEPLLEALKTAITDVSTYNIPTTVMEFVEQLLNLKPMLEDAQQSHDELTASLVYSLYTSVIECHSRLLLQSALEARYRDTVLQIVTIMVQCAATPGQYPSEETASNIPFSVWFTLQDDIMTFEGDQLTELLQLFRGVYLKLVDTFIEKSLLPPDGALSSEEKEMFRCYRQDICDTYMYAYFILRGDMLSHLESHLQKAVLKMQTDPTDWRYLEAILHAYSSVAETVAESDNYYVPRFIQSIPQIPFADNVQLISVALTTLGAYADWLNYHHDNLQYVIPLMVAGLLNTSLVGAASQALRDLTLECPFTITPFSQQILSCCQRALEQSSVESAETERILTIISRVLSVGMDHATIMTYLNTTLTPYISRLSHLKDVMDGGLTRGQRAELVSILKLLSCLARHLNLNTAAVDEDEEEEDSTTRQSRLMVAEAQPLLLVLQQIMPLITQLAAKASNDPEIIEALCKLLKNSVSTLVDDSIALLPSILESIPQLYEASLNPAILDLVKQLVILFGKDTTQEGNMKVLLRMVVVTTLQRASGDLWGQTDAVQACLLLLTAVLKKTPHLLMQDAEDLTPLFHLGVEALKLPEDSTIKWAGQFLSSFVLLSRDPSCAGLHPIVSHNIETLVRTLMFCICNSPRHSLSSFGDVLSATCKMYGDDLARTFKTIQADEPFPSPRVNAQQKEEFAKKILKNRGSKKRIQEAVTDLALISRGIAGTEYGSQTRGFH